MKFIWMALIMAAVLFVYGYLLSTAGHNHASHMTQDGHPEHNHH